MRTTTALWRLFCSRQFPQIDKLTLVSGVGDVNGSSVAITTDVHMILTLPSRAS